MLKLNVGGKRYYTLPGTVRGTMIEKLCSTAVGTVRDSDGAFFLDRDPDLFQHVLSYLRTRDVTCDPKDNVRFLGELDYFQIEHDLPERLDKDDQLLRKAIEEIMNFPEHNAPLLIQIKGEFVVRDEISYGNVLKVATRGLIEELCKKLQLYPTVSKWMSKRAEYGGVAYYFQ